MRLDLESLAVVRAEEQLASYDLAEPTRHDGWAIRPTEYVGRARKIRARRCWACERRGTHPGGYCHKHWKQVAKGCPVDCDRLPTFREQTRMGRILAKLERGRVGFVPYDHVARAASDGRGT